MHRWLFILLLFSTHLALAQFGKNCEVRQFKLNIFNPGIEYEMGLGVNSTLDVRIAWQLALDPFAMEPIENYEFFPAITVQNRYYYNFGSRGRRGRQIYGNSANYVAPTISIFEPGSRLVEGEIAEGVYGAAGLVTGLQRSYNSGLSFSIDVGAGYYVGPFRGGIYPMFNISLGWIISEKRWCVGR
ncbi:hypothetical protein [Flagellimonas allohymeniacidonis]|uniref:DUF3575 domain-containing protein n=1 Tax=Flagellimonas allohymeniacidonis TaxID=2517819 RepID=A0A4Q8QG71_9FLAO|nr:hypothetical protein [Allomuricauda hymeniacidonis]TAI49552.1 hypothetical protein EW142_07065 [Allomuricauda hymeniacidonis]